MNDALENARREYPPNEGWSVFPVGSRVVAWNRWSCHRVDVCRVKPAPSTVDYSPWRKK